MQYHEKLLLLKRLAYPLVVAADRAGLFWLAAPLLNAACRVLGLKRRFNSDMEYRIYAKAFARSFEDAEGRPAVAFVSWSGANDLHGLRNLMIGRYLQERGHHPVYIVCDGVLGVCSRDRISRPRATLPFFCHECCGGYPEVARRTGADWRFLSAHRTPDVLQAIREVEIEAGQLGSIDECERYQWRDVPLGRLCKVSVLYFLTVGAFTNTPEELAVYRRYLVAGATVLLLLERAFDAIPRLGCVMTNNGLLFHDAIARHIAHQRGIREVTQETYDSRDSWIYRRNGVAVMMDYDEDWRRFASGPALTPEQTQQVSVMMSARRSGQSFAYVYNAPDAATVAPQARRTVGLFTNFTWDTTVLDRNAIFDSMEQWIVETIEYWHRREPRAQLVVRAHPAEAKLLTMPSARYVRDIVRGLIDGRRVTFIDSDEEVNSYSLIDAMDFGLVYSSSIGLEIAYAGKACVVAGDCHYRGKGFVQSPSSREEYFEMLDALSAKPAGTDDQARRELDRYLHFIYERKVKHLRGFAIGGHSGQPTIDVRDGDALVRLNEDVLDEFYREAFAC